MRDVHLHVTFGRRFLICVGAVAALLAAAPELDSENVTVHTYYPAPSGVYTNMITTGNTYLARDGGAASKVGIGTASPASKLSVAGGVQMGNDFAACTLAGAGTMRYNAGAIQYCNGALATPSWVSLSSSSPVGFVNGVTNGGATIVHNRGQFVVVGLTSGHWDQCGGSGACIPPGAHVCAQTLNSFTICNADSYAGAAPVKYWYYYW